MINQPSTFLTSVSCHEQSKALKKAMDFTQLSNIPDSTDTGFLESHFKMASSH